MKKKRRNGKSIRDATPFPSIYQEKKLSMTFPPKKRNAGIAGLA
jgi:hypothetical protein